MRLVGKIKLRSLGTHFRGIAQRTPVVLGLADLDSHRDALTMAGFSTPLVIGETVLPTSAGKVSSYNAEGDYIVHRDQPMETAYRQIEWTWTEFRGRYDRVERSRVVDVPYKRYPRTFRPPPSVELTISQDASANLILSTPLLAYTAENEEALLHRVNLMRELFGEVEIFTQDLDPVLGVAVRRVNWEVLPPGQMPWPSLQQRLEPLLNQMGARAAPVAEQRLKLLTEEHTPDFAAVGRAGFSGYLVFGFENRGLYVFESLRYGNATYVFTGDWEALSQMTKAEILAGGLHEHRLIHREGWVAQMRGILR
jgi:hypothetical protein